MPESASYSPCLVLEGANRVWQSMAIDARGKPGLAGGVGFHLPASDVGEFQVGFIFTDLRIQNNTNNKRGG